MIRLDVSNSSAIAFDLDRLKTLGTVPLAAGLGTDFGFITSAPALPPPPSSPTPAVTSVAPAMWRLVEFVRRQGIAPALVRALTLAEECLHPVEPPVLGLQHDPETGDRWVVVEVRLRGDADAAMAAYQEYTEKIVAHLSYGDQRYIRLSIHVE